MAKDTQNEQGVQKKQRIDAVDASFMLFAASTLDGASLAISAFSLGISAVGASVGWVPIVGTILGGAVAAVGTLMSFFFPLLVTLLGIGLFYPWFYFRGVNLLFGAEKRAIQKMVATVLAMLAESFFPIAPGWVIWVALIIIIVRVEDAEYNEKHSPQKKNILSRKITRARNAGKGYLVAQYERRLAQANQES